MDLKALIAKMDHIESKKILNEGFPTVADAKARADKEKTTGKFDKKELSTGTQYTRKSSTFDDGGKDKDQKKAEKKKKNESFSFKPGGIAHYLLSEFNLAEAPVTNPYQGADAAKFAAMSPQDQAWLTKGGGKPDINDAAILARAPNKGKAVAAAAPAVSNPQNPGGMSDEEVLARQNPGGMSDEEVLARQQTTGPGATSAATGVGNPGEEAAAQAAADKAKATAGAPGAQDDVTGVDAAVAAQAAAKPTAAAGATTWPTTPEEIKAFQTANKLKPDGLIGAQTMAALQKAGATPPAGFKPVGNKAKPAAGQAAQPAVNPAAAPGAPNQSDAETARLARQNTAANPAIAKLDAEIKRFSAKNDMTIAANQKYVAGLEAKKAAAGGQAAQPAAAPTAAPAAAPKTFAQDTAARKAAAQPGALGSGTYQTQSVRNEDDAILERIRNALFR